MFIWNKKKKTNNETNLFEQNWDGLDLFQIASIYNSVRETDIKNDRILQSNADFCIWWILFIISLRTRAIISKIELCRNGLNRQTISHYDLPLWYSTQSRERPLDPKKQNKFMIFFVDWGLVFLIFDKITKPYMVKIYIYIRLQNLHEELIYEW